MSARVIYFSPLPWRSFAQRPHQMVRYMVERCDAQVTWVEPYPTRLPRWDDRRRIRETPAAPEVPWASRVTVIDVPALPLEPLPGGAWLNHRVAWRRVRDELSRRAEGGASAIGVGKPSALAVWALGALPHRTSFYDAMDDFPAFFRGRSHTAAVRAERAIAAAVDRVIVCTPVVRGKFAGLAVAPQLVPNGFDPRGLPAPAAKKAGPPVLGFVGTLGPWFDWAWVRRVARDVPQLRIVIIGPTRAAVPARLPGNIERVGEMPHADAMRAMRAFTVGLLPFADSPVARAMDPIKLYEYRALGLPVLASPVGSAADLGEADGVFLLGEGAATGDLLERALRYVASPEAVRHVRETCSWDSRFDAANLGAVL